MLSQNFRLTPLDRALAMTSPEQHVHDGRRSGDQLQVRRRGRRPGLADTVTTGPALPALVPLIPRNLTGSPGGREQAYQEYEMQK